MRRVAAPGREWKVGRQWLPARVRIRRDNRDAGDDDDSDGDGFLDTMQLRTPSHVARSRQVPRPSSGS